jgi:hypothetical protein
MLKQLTILLLMLLVLTGGVLAQAPQPDTAIISYNGIEFSYSPGTFGAVLPAYNEGTPFQTDAPYFANTAPHTAFAFLKPDPTRPEVNLVGELRVYRIADLEAYGEPSYKDTVQQLRNLDTTDLSSYANAAADYNNPSLPYLPVLNATQVFRAFPAALNVERMNGIEYYFYASQSAEPILEGQISYSYQGITTDGQYYLSFSIPVEMGLLETVITPDIDWDAFSANYAQYLQDTFATINNADPATFSPTSAELRSFVGSITIHQ